MQEIFMVARGPSSASWTHGHTPPESMFKSMIKMPAQTCNRTKHAPLHEGVACGHVAYLIDHNANKQTVDDIYASCAWPYLIGFLVLRRFRFFWGFF